MRVDQNVGRTSGSLGYIDGNQSQNPAPLKICARELKFSKKRSYINVEFFKDKRQKT